MRSSFKVGFCPENVSKIILVTGPKFHFSTSNGTGVIKKTVHGRE